MDDERVNDGLFLSLQKKVSFEPTTSYLLKNLKPFSAYTFQLAAKSKNGIGAYTNEVSIDTPQTRRSTCTHGSMSVCVSERVWRLTFDNANVKIHNGKNKETI